MTAVFSFPISHLQAAMVLVFRHPVEASVFERNVRKLAKTKQLPANLDVDTFMATLRSGKISKETRELLRIVKDVIDCNRTVELAGVFKAHSGFQWSIFDCKYSLELVMNACQQPFDNGFFTTEEKLTGEDLEKKNQLRKGFYKLRDQVQRKLLRLYNLYSFFKGAERVQSSGERKKECAQLFADDLLASSKRYQDKMALIEEMLQMKGNCTESNISNFYHRYYLAGCHLLHMNLSLYGPEKIRWLVQTRLKHVKMVFRNMKLFQIIPLDAQKSILAAYAGIMLPRLLTNIAFKIIECDNGIVNAYAKSHLIMMHATPASMHAIARLKEKATMRYSVQPPSVDSMLSQFCPTKEGSTNFFGPGGIEPVSFFGREQVDRKKIMQNYVAPRGLMVFMDEAISPTDSGVRKLDTRALIEIHNKRTRARAWVEQQTVAFSEEAIAALFPVAV